MKKIVSLARPIKRLPLRTASSGARLGVEVRVAPMTDAIARQWHENVQRRWIDKEYAVARKGAPSDAKFIRADVGWDWRQIRFMSSLANRLGGNFGPCYAWSVLTSSPQQQWHPIGMLTVVPEFRSHVVQLERERVFAWYLSAAPGELYAEDWGMAPVVGGTKALIDSAAQTGFDLGSDGDFLLHASPAGGEGLRQFYAAQGFSALSTQDPPVSTLRALMRHSVSEYFHMSAPDVESYCRRLDPLR